MRALKLLLTFLLTISVVQAENPPSSDKRLKPAQTQTERVAARSGDEVTWPPVDPESLPASRSESLSSLPLVRPDRTAGNSTGGDATQKSHSSRGGWTTSIALGFVVVLMLGMAKVFSRKNPFAVPGLPLSAIEVLGRRSVDPRNSIYVVKVGGKVLLVAGSSNGLSPLSEITDPIEVATLITACHLVEPSRESFLDRLRELAGSKHDREPQSFENQLRQQLQVDEIALTPQQTGLPSGRMTEGRHAR